MHTSQYNLATQPPYLPTQSYTQLPNPHHHHSMINLNHNHTPVPEPIVVEPLATESPTMSNSPVPAPPAPPLNPSCARCRFTSSVSTHSNGTLHRQPMSVGSNPHLHATLSHQNSQPSYGLPPSNASAYPGELYLQVRLFEPSRCQKLSATRQSLHSCSAVNRLDHAISVAKSCVHLKPKRLRAQPAPNDIKF